MFLALRTKVLDKPSFITQIAQWTATIDGGFGESVLELHDLLSVPLDDAVDRISGLGLEPEALSDWDRISPFVVPSVIWSLYSFLRTPTDYWTAVCTAIRVGGDVDTTAAMTGAISGALLGLEALPPHLAIRVRDRDTWGYDDLVSLANRCFDMTVSQ